MKLSTLITNMQATLEKHGDTENVALGLVMGHTTKYRMDAFGDIDVLHDTGEFPNGMAYLVAEYHGGRDKPPNVKIEGPLVVDPSRMMDTRERIARHLRQLAPHVRERETGELLAAALVEIDLLRQIATNAHDRLLRGDDDREILAILGEAWNGPN